MLSFHSDLILYYKILLIFLFDIKYAPGTLEAVSYKGNEVISKDTLVTTGPVSTIKLTAEKSEMAADGHSVTYIQAELLDAAGNLVPVADNRLTATVSGAGFLAAFGSANPITAENYTEGTFTAYRGRATAIIRSGYTSGICTLTISGEGLESVSTKIDIK